MDIEEIHDYCKDLAFSGKDYAYLKAKVEQLCASTSISEKDKTKILVKADEYLAHYQFASLEKNKALQQMIVGAILFFLGIGLSGYTYSILFKQYYLFYGLILIGAWILKEGYKTYQIPLEDFPSPLDNISRRIR